MDEDQYEDFVEEVNEEYEEIREDHYDSLKVRDAVVDQGHVTWCVWNQKLVHCMLL